MNLTKRIFQLTALVAFFSLASCSTDIEPYEGGIPPTDQTPVTPVDPALLPTISTSNVSNIFTTSAQSGGSITADGGSTISARGVVWSTSSNPTVSNSKTVDGTGLGNFTSSITGLTANTLYYLRSYATNGSGTSYGQQVTFTTSAVTAPGLPVLTTTPVTNNVYPGAKSGGNITSDGGSPITERGVVWSTISNPSLPTTKKTIDGTGSGTFVSTIAQLQVVPGTTVYLRAYATNSNGTSYGNQITFVLAPSQVDNSPAMMTANVNGVQYNFMQPYLYSFTGNDVIVQNDGAPAGVNRYLWIQGDTSDTIGSSTEINLHIPSDKWVLGTYPLVDTFDLSGPSICQANLVLPYIAGNPDFSTVTGGSITITEFNLTTKRIKGTFTITYQKSGSSTTYQITNGTFNYGLDDDYFN